MNPSTLIGIPIVLLLSLLSACSSTATRDGDYTPDKLVELNTQLGIAHMREGNYETARNKLQKALDIDPKYPVAHNILGLVYSQMGEKQQAEQHLEEALRLAPNDASTLNNYGRLLCQEGRAQEAQAMFAKALENPRREPPEIAHTNAGVCAAQNKDFTAAEQHLQQALKFNPRLPAALLEMANVNFQLKRYLPARGYMQRYMAATAPTAHSLWLAIQIERNMDSPPGVAEYSQMLRAKFPNSVEAQQVR